MVTMTLTADTPEEFASALKRITLPPLDLKVRNEDLAKAITPWNELGEEPTDKRKPIA